MPITGTGAGAAAGERAAGGAADVAVDGATDVATDGATTGGTPPEAPRFCCSGCRAVWSVLHECGLEHYYRVREGAERVPGIERAGGAGFQSSAGLAPRPPSHDSIRSRAELDSPDFLSRHAETLGSDRRRIELRVDGLRCGACIWLLEALPRLVPGVLELRVDAGRALAAIDWDSSRTALSAVARAVERLGYRLLPLNDPAARERDRAADRRWLIRLGASAVLSANAMGIAFALYGGFFDGMEARIRLFLQWVAMALGAASVFGPGRLFLSNAIASLRSRVPHMDLPITLALLAAIVGGFVSTLRGGGGVYAESVTMLVMLLLAGRFVQFRSQSRARHEVELLATLVPGVARRVRRGDGARPARGAAELDAPAWDEVPVESLVAGDLVLVPTGDAACADGVLRGAPNSIDMQALTGESRPVKLRDGERVWAGCRPLRSPMLIEVTAAGAATRAGQLMALVDAALARRARVVEFANRIAGWFLLAVVALAALTVALWWSEGPAVAIEHAVALLVVTCPCALGLATPLTMVASIAKAARAGILIKGGDLIERLAVPGTIVLDKTGTLTEGRMRVVEIDGDESALAWAAALERSSTHPIARAIVRAQAERSATRSAERGPRASAIDRLEPEHAEVAGAAVESIQEHLGLGVRGDVDGVAVAVGRLEFVAREAAPSWERRARGLAERGLTPAAVSIDGRVRALLGVGDPIRADAAPTVRELRRRGWRVILASGDDAAIVRSCAEAIGVPPHDAFGECSPERKAELVRRCDWPRPLLMVGDGVNDVVAMASADAGISLGGGTRASLEVGDVCLARDGIGALPPLLRGAARSMRVVHANFSIGLVYNLVGAALAIGGWMNPLIAAILMPLSGLMVTAIAVRGPRFSNDARAPASSGGPDPHPSLAPEAVR